MNKLVNVLFFVAGAAVGAGAGYFATKEKIYKDAQEEINEYKNQLTKKILEEAQAMKDSEEEEKEEVEKTYKSTANKPDIMQVKAESEQVNYSDYSKSGTKEIKPKKNSKAKKAKEASKNRKLEKYNNYDMEDFEYEDISEAEDAVIDAYPKEGPADEPYSISPEQFANENQYYDKITLMYYNDHILATEEGDDITGDIKNTVGNNFNNFFGEYENDVAYVRNEQMGADYEIIVEHHDFYEG